MIYKTGVLLSRNLKKEPGGAGWHLGLLLPRVVDAGGQLQCPQRLHVVGQGVGHVGHHGSSAVDVTKGFSKQHDQLTVPE